MPPQVASALPKNPNTKVGSLNVGGALATKIGELEEFLKEGRYDIVALQEVRAVEKLAVDGYKYFPAVNTDGHGGVALLVALHIVPLITVLPKLTPTSCG